MKDFDVVFKVINPLGPYQKFHTALLIFSNIFMNAYVVFGLVFLAYTPEFWCVEENIYISDNASIGENQLNSSWRKLDAEVKNNPFNYTLINLDPQEVGSQNDSTNACNCPSENWKYSAEFLQSTIVTEWDLVCEKAIQPKIVINVLYGVTGAGCIVLSIIQDRIGRKPTLNILTICVLLGHVFTRFAPSIVTFTAMRAFASFTAQSVFNHGYVWAVEFVGPTKRTLVTVLMFAAYGMAISSYALLAYLVNSWKDLSLVISLPFLLNFSYNWILSESPRWSIQKGKFDEAVQTLSRMLAWEGKSPATRQQIIDDLEELMEIRDASNEKEMKNRKSEESENILNNAEMSSKAKYSADQPPHLSKPGALSLFKTPNLRYKTILICCCHLITNTTYIGLAFNTENLGGNPFMTFVAMSMMEVPAVLCNLVLLERFGRIAPLSGFLLFTGIICCLTSPASYFSVTWLVVPLSVMGKFGICLSNSIVEQLEAELFPTEVRATGKGYACLCAAVGNMVMPFIIHSATVYKMLPMILLGSMAGMGSFLAIQLPETRGTLLPETVEEAEMRGIPGLKTAVKHLQFAFGTIKKQNNFTIENEPLDNRPNDEKVGI